MALITDLNSLSSVLNKSGASAPTPISAPPVPPEEGSVFDAFTGKWKARAAGTLASNPYLSQDASNYAKRGAANATKQAEEEYSRLGTIGQIATDFSDLGAYGLLALSPARGVVLPAAVAGTTYADVVTEQGKKGDYDSSRALQTAVTSAMLPTGPAKGLVKTLTQDAILSGGEQALVNVGAGKDITEGVGEAALFGAAGGQALRKLGDLPSALKKTKTEDSDAAKTFAEETNATQEEIDTLRKKATESTTEIERDAALEEAINFQAEKGGRAADMAALRLVEEEGLDMIDAGFNFSTSEGLSRTKGDRNFGESFGKTQKEMISSAEIAEAARKKLIFGDDVENTKVGDQTKFQKDFKRIFGTGMGSFGKNVDTVEQMWKDAKANPNASKEEVSKLSDLKHHLGKLKAFTEQYVGEKRIETGDSIKAHSQAAEKLASDLGITSSLQGVNGREGTWNPIQDVMVLDRIDQMGRSRMKNVHKGAPDVGKGIGISGTDIAIDLATGAPLLSGLKIAKQLRAGASQKAQKKQKASTKETLQGLTKKPKEVAKKIEEIIEEPAQVVDEIVPAAQEVVQEARSKLSPRTPKKPTSDEPQPASEVIPEVQEAVEQVRTKLTAGTPKKLIQEEAPVVEPEKPAPFGQRTPLAQREKMMAEEESRLRNSLLDKSPGSDELSNRVLDEIGGVKGLKKANSEAGHGPTNLRNFFNELVRESGEKTDTSIADRIKSARERRKASGMKRLATKEEQLKKERDAEAKKLKSQQEAADRKQVAADKRQAVIDAEDKEAKDYLHANKQLFEDAEKGGRYSDLMKMKNSKWNSIVNEVGKARDALERLASNEEAKLQKTLREGDKGDQVVEEAHFKRLATLHRQNEARMAEARKKSEEELAKKEAEAVAAEAEAKSASEAAKVEEPAQESIEAPQESVDELVEEVATMSPDELKSAGKAGTEIMVKTGEDDVLVAVEEKMKSEGMESEAEKIATVRKLLDKMMARKKQAPQNKELWASYDDVNEIQNMMGKTYGSSHAGNLWKKIRTELYGDNREDHAVLKDKEVEARLAKKKGALGHLFGELPQS